MRRLTLCLLAFLPFAPLRAAPPENSVLLLSTGLVLQAKLDLVAESARAHGFAVTIAVHEKTKDEPLQALLAQSAWLIVDTPRPTDFETLSARLAKLAGEKPPRQLWVGRSEKRWFGFDDQRGDLLWSYYRHGGKRNFTHFFEYLRRWQSGQDTASVSPPQELPAAGAYHPRFPAGFSADVRAVLDAVRVPGSRGVVGVGFHSSYLESAAVEQIDALVVALEQRGVTALPLFYSLGPDADLPKLMQGIVDVHFHLQPVYHNGYAAQLEKLGIPVLQGIGWSDNGADNYRQDRVGLPLSTTPLYLALPEQNGLIDPMVGWARGTGRIEIIPEQIDAMADKAAAYVRLRATPRAERQVAIMIYNYPPGDKNMAASFMNIPRSLERISSALKDAGYTVEPRTEAQWIEQLGRVLAGLHHPEKLPALAADGLAEEFPLARYHVWYDRLPAPIRERIEARWGKPEDSAFVRGDAFYIPRVLDGRVTLLPQPPRSQPGKEDERSLYHDLRVPVNHYYLATYLWAREQFAAHALVHLGTHGTQEWMPGKERGLHVHDDPLLALGALPIVYPYIVDNVGEATQAKRRGRAVMVSHQTPLFRPSGLHGKLVELHNLLHQYLTLEEGEVKRRTAARLKQEVLGDKILSDMGWSTEKIDADFDAFQLALHDYLHALAAQAQPIGLHTFGRTGDDKARLTTVLQMLGTDFFKQLGIDDPTELFADDYEKIEFTQPYRWLAGVLGLSAEKPGPRLPELEERAKALYEKLLADSEVTGLLTALDGKHVSPSVGGDPLRAPESLPTGRNLYGFDPSTLPTKEAWETGRAAVDALIEQHCKEHGAPPKKLAYSLWAVEAMRHGGVLESQALYAMGVRPVWNPQGRVTGVEVIPREKLGRPRIDAVLSATGLYRDQFPNIMAHLAKAAALVADLNETDNPSYANTQTILADLLAQGVSKDEAASLAKTRLFGSPTGVYGTGLEDAAQASDSWEKDDKLAQLYLRRMSYAYGPDPSKWGKGEDGGTLYAANLRGVEGAILARTSNLYGMLTTDDPFQYLGGISLAVRHLTGKSPELYISNQRQPGTARIESAARFLATELNTRAFHPGWVKSMQAEGYAGALDLQDMVNNLWGWQVMDRKMVSAAQWQRLHEVYVKDDLDLDMREWFEKHQPEALVRMTERMLEAIRKEYWDAPEATRRELVETWTQLTQKYAISAGNEKIKAFAEGLAAGYGIAGAAPAAPVNTPPPAPATPPPPAATTAQVQGQQLEKVAAPASEKDVPAWWLFAALLFPFLVGAARQFARRR
ncbi:MAG: cobaltochelatase subunit CobN [Verrucomicrobia bacterium]|nr:cobaltochelatase subunit CobN [Verrucomicrobiota bacterium]